MRNKIVILLLFLSGFIFGQSVPNTNTFKLSDVSAVVGGISLSQTFTNSVDAYFDPTYKGNKDRLSNFRNYTIPSGYASGKYITSVTDGDYIYRSNDYGSTWLQVGSSQIWRGISMDSTGMYQTAVVNGGYIYISDNYGVSWSQQGVSQYWNDIGVNKFSGVYQTAVCDNGIWTSSDYGLIWTQRLSGVSINCVFVSPSGQYQIAASDPGYIYISTNYGVNWTQITTAGSGNWVGVFVDINANSYYGIINGGHLYKSINGGSSWYSVDFNGNTNYYISIIGNSSGDVLAGSTSSEMFFYYSGGWGPTTNIIGGDLKVDCGDGKIIVCCTIGSGYLWKTDNYGSTWTQLESISRAWTDIATN